MAMVSEFLSGSVRDRRTASAVPESLSIVAAQLTGRPSRGPNGALAERDERTVRHADRTALSRSETSERSVTRTERRSRGARRANGPSHGPNGGATSGDTPSCAPTHRERVAREQSGIAVAFSHYEGFRARRRCGQSSAARPRGSGSYTSRGPQRFRSLRMGPRRKGSSCDRTNAAAGARGRIA
jgi:hypothetical protein